MRSWPIQRLLCGLCLAFSFRLVIFCCCSLSCVYCCLTTGARKILNTFAFGAISAWDCHMYSMKLSTMPYLRLQWIALLFEHLRFLWRAFNLVARTSCGWSFMEMTRPGIHWSPEALCVSVTFAARTVSMKIHGIHNVEMEVQSTVLQHTRRY